jgi:hypothetical protein
VFRCQYHRNGVDHYIPKAQSIMRSLLSGSYPRFSGEQFVWDYLTNITTTSKIIQDWIIAEVELFSFSMVAVFQRNPMSILAAST